MENTGDDIQNLLSNTDVDNLMMTQVIDLQVREHPGENKENSYYLGGEGGILDSRGSSPSLIVAA